MLLPVRQLIDNLKQKDAMSYEQILGSAHNVGVWADMWENNSECIELFVANELLLYSGREKPYTREEYQAFREGILSIRKFAQGCCAERKIKIEQDKKQQELQKQAKKD